MRILVTGVNDWVVRDVVSSLVAQKAYEVRVLEPIEHRAWPEDVEVVAGDLRIPEVARECVTGLDSVLHMQPVSLALLPPGNEAELLDEVMRGTRSLLLAAMDAKVERLILGSTLGFFDRMPEHWCVDERWRPRPDPTMAHLLPWLAELTTRELIRLGTMETICLRFGKVVDSETAEKGPFDPRWVHVNDVIHAIERALCFDHGRMLDAGRPDWSVFHIMGAGPNSKIKHSNATGIEERSTSSSAPFCYVPQVDLSSEVSQREIVEKDSRPWQEILSPPVQIPSRPIRKIVIFGAGGPMGASTARSLMEGYTLRLADIRPIPEVISELKSKNEYQRIVPPSLDPPHETVIVDVRDPEQVMAACEGMDAIANCSVLRMDPVESFRVSAVGPYNMARAAVHYGIRRFVQTGPLLHLVNGHGSHQWDYQIPVEAPSRPYESLYFNSKYLGQEILRVFAEYYGLEVAVMLFCELVNPNKLQHQPPFFISWADAGRALRRGLEIPELPSPYEEFNISVDLPHDKFNHRKIRDVLGWEPVDNLDHFWQKHT